MMAKGGFAEFKRYKHNDMNDLERVLKSIPEDAGKLVASDGVFSTTGEIVDLPKMVELCKNTTQEFLLMTLIQPELLVKEEEVRLLNSD